MTAHEQLVRRYIRAHSKLHHQPVPKVEDIPTSYVKHGVERWVFRCAHCNHNHAMRNPALREAVEAISPAQCDVTKLVRVVVRDPEPEVTS